MTEARGLRVVSGSRNAEIWVPDIEVPDIDVPGIEVSRPWGGDATGTAARQRDSSLTTYWSKFA